ncbi:hypothetical protein PAXRUDRAFT_178557, partial [Paxillus rubicundulus Ve08.2h10]
ISSLHILCRRTLSRLTVGRPASYRQLHSWARPQAMGNTSPRPRQRSKPLNPSKTDQRRCGSVRDARRSLPRPRNRSHARSQDGCSKDEFKAAIAERAPHGSTTGNCSSGK